MAGTRRTVDLPYNKVTRETVRLAGLTQTDFVLEAPVDAAAFRRAFDAMAGHGIDSIWTAGTGEMLEHRRLIAELATAARLPTAFTWRENVEAGGLISYGNDVADTFRRSAGYIDRIFRGANPAELPVEQASKFELVINQTAAEVARPDPATHPRS